MEENLKHIGVVKLETDINEFDERKDAIHQSKIKNFFSLASVYIVSFSIMKNNPDPLC